MDPIRLPVDAIACGAPASEVEETLQARETVAEAQVDLEEEVVSVTLHDGAGEDDVREVLDFYGLDLEAPPPS